MIPTEHYAELERLERAAIQADNASAADDIDLEDAARFVEALTGSADTPMTWQTYDDRKNSRRPFLAQVLHGSLRDLAGRLASDFPPPQLTLHVADALAFDFATLGPALRIVGNLPYNISSPLLFHLAQFDALIVDVHVMLQKEVVARMTAAPATPEYGRLTVMLQALFRVARLFAVPAGAFRPVPKVDSAVVRLVPLGEKKPDIADVALFGRIVAAAFGQRRKTMRNALSTICDEAALRRAGIDPGARGETLAVGEFVRLANALAGHRE